MSIVRWILVAATTALGVTLVGSWFLARNEPLEYTAEGKARRLWHRLAREAPAHDVFVIAIDTLRADALGVYGGDPSNSPALDRFAAECTVFEEAVPAACWTLPSFSSIFTGLYPPAHAVEDDESKADDRLITLAEILSGLGYRTGAFTAGGYLAESFGLDQGFDEFKVGKKTRLLDESIAPAKEWLSSIDRSERVFAFVHGFDPHRPYRPATLPSPPAGYAAPALDAGDAMAERVTAGGTLDEFPLGDVKVAYHTVDLGRTRDFDEIYRTWMRAKAPSSEQFHQLWKQSPRFSDELAWLRALYDAELRAADAAVEDFLAFLRRSGRYDDAIVIFLSDHGEQFMEHSTIGHTRTSRAESRVPLLVRLPGGKRADQPARCAEVVRGIDVMPTVLHVLGLPAPAIAQGRSLLPLLQGVDLPDLPACTFGTKYPEDGVTFRNWRFIERTVKEEGDLFGDRLYDIGADPNEARDVTAEHADVDARMRAFLSTTRAESEAIGAQFGAAVDGSNDDEDALTQLGYVGDAEAKKSKKSKKAKRPDNSTGER
ncbi:MAG: sulfatase [Planctomycetes bacterium]|nr:sulfatase [Planctomycetota bacterium]